MGIGEIILVVVLLVATGLSIASRRLAFCSVAVGVAMLAWFALSVAFGDSHPVLAAPYRVINLYVFLFIAVLLMLAGCIGLVVHFVRHLRHGSQS
jgi:hypothetical protein